MTAMQIRNRRDFFAGLIHMTVGVAFVLGARTHHVGNGATMGPGYFPLILGVLLTGLGVAITFKGLALRAADAKPIGRWAWRPLFFIIAANLVFGVAIGGLPSIKVPALGLIAGIYALTFIASLAGEEFRFKEVLVLATVLAVMSYLTFVLLLRLEFPVWPVLG
jgi:hypothetical protein